MTHSTITTPADNTSKWVQVKRKTFPDGRAYDFVSHPWCLSRGVAVVPYRHVKDYSLTELGITETEYLARFEIHAAHDDFRFEMGAITGGYDKPNENYAECAARELYEEAGYSVEADKLQFIGHVHPSKATDTVMYLYAVDLSDYTGEVVAPVGDGTACEEGGYAKWVRIGDAVKSVDPLFVTAIARINHSHPIHYIGGNA
jgi:8-oxo-dGTP pyrophosphatase MutT (NUDIX family)